MVKKNTQINMFKQAKISFYLRNRRTQRRQNRRRVLQIRQGSGQHFAQIRRDSTENEKIIINKYNIIFVDIFE